jgi:hypothetical protein
LTHNSDPRSRAVIIRQSTRWFREFIERHLADAVRTKMKRVYGVVERLTFLPEDSPNSKCRPPVSPK